MRDAATRFFTPRSGTFDLGDIVQIGDEQAALLRDGMEVLVGYLWNVRDGIIERPALAYSFNPS